MVGFNIGVVSGSYNTGKVTGGNRVGSVVGWNPSGIVSSYWLEGTNTTGIGVNGGTNSTSSFSAIGSTISVIYTSMSYITASAGGNATGAIIDITFGGDSVNPTMFSALQGSYILSGSSLTLTVSGISGASITVATSSALNTLLTSGGNVVDPTSAGESTYIMSGLGGGTWILIKSINAENPKSNRIYTIYIS